MPSSSLRLIIVDDEEAILFAFRHYFTEHSFAVDTTTSLHGVATLSSGTTYHGAIVDLRLSGNNVLEGFQAIRMIHSHSPACVIVVCTAFSDDKTKNQAFSAGADVVVEKPASPASIHSILKNRV